jgi:hypothetical protein
VSGAAACDKKSPTQPTTTVQSVRLTASSTTLPASGGDTELTASVTLTTGAPGGGIPVTFTADKGTFNVATVTTDAQGQSKVRLRTTETANVRATANGVTGELRVEVKSFATITLRSEPAEPEVGAPVVFTVTARRGTADVTGELTMIFEEGATSTTRTVNINGTATLEHTYQNPGSFNVRTRVDESDGTSTPEAFRVEVRARAFSPGSGGDDIDATQVNYIHRNIARWDITSTITDITITRSEICIDHTAAGRFPTSILGDIRVEGNTWVFAKFGGQWFGATYDWLRPGQVCKAVTGDELGVDQIRRAPMDGNWAPRTGDEIGFAVSTRARDEVEAGEERTNIKVIRWP